jgi:hypothetical protein
LDSLTRGQRGGSPTYLHGRGLPWLQLNAGRQGISYGGAEAQRANDHWPGLTLLPMILLLFFGWGSVPHIHISSSQRGRLSPHWVLASCGRIWFAGDGAFAPEAWVGSAIQPYPFFLIRADSRDSRASPTYSHGSGLPWLQLKAGRQGISHGGAEAQRGNEH